MKSLLFIGVTLFCFTTFASVSLPLGGEVFLNLGEWDSRVIPAGETRTMVFIHKKHQELQGYVLDGFIKTTESCNKEKQGVSWALCPREVKMSDILSFQYILERKAGKKSFQTYIVSFNVPESKVALYKPILEKLKTQMEKGK